MSKGATTGTLDKTYVDTYALMGTLDALENATPEVFFDWSIGGDVAPRYYMPIIKDYTVTALWFDVTPVVGDYRCTSITGAIDGTTEGAGTFTLKEDGTLAWYTDGTDIGEFVYDGEHLLFTMYNSIGDVSATVSGSSLIFDVTYGMSTVSYVFEKYEPAIVGEFASAAGDLLVFSGVNSVSFESEHVRDGMYLRGTYTKSDNVLSVSGSSLSTLFSTMTITINQDGTLAVVFTASGSNSYSVNATFSRLPAPDYSGEGFVGEYSIAYVSSGYSDAYMTNYTMIFDAYGGFIYRSNYSDTVGRYYYFEQTNALKVILEGNASTFVYDEDGGFLYGTLSRGAGTTRRIVATPSSRGNLYAYIIDGPTNVVFVNNTERYYIRNGELVADAVVEGEFTNGARVTVDGSEYYVRVKEASGYNLALTLELIGPEEGEYSLSGEQFVLDGVKTVSGAKSGTYKVYDGIVVALLDDDTIVAFDYVAAQSNLGTIAVIDPDAYQGVWYLGRDENPKYYRFAVDGFGHAALFYLKDGVYQYNWGGNVWGTYSENATGIHAIFNSSQEADVVFYYDKNVAYSQRFGYMGESTFVKDGYDGTTTIPSFPKDLAGNYTGGENETAVTLNLLESGSGTLNGLPITNTIFDGSKTIYFTSNSVQYTLTIGAANALTLQYGDTTVALTRTGDVTDVLPVGLAGLWRGEFSGFGGGVRDVYLTTTGVDCYYIQATTPLSNIEYNYDTNTLTATFGSGEDTVYFTMVWDAAAGTLTVTGRNAENTTWEAVLTKVE